MLVLGVETSTPQTSVALGSEGGIIAELALAKGPAGHEVAVPAVAQLLRWAETEVGKLGGIAVGIGPGLFTGMRVGIATGRALAQVLRLPIVGVASLDALAFGARYSRRLIVSVIDARRREVFYAFYRPLVDGVVRETGYEVGSPQRLIADIEAQREDVLLLGNGALEYRDLLAELGSQAEFASPGLAFPSAAALVEIAVPKLVREEGGGLADVVPLYVRKSDAEIAWDRRARSA